MLDPGDTKTKDMMTSHDDCSPGPVETKLARNTVNCMFPRGDQLGQVQGFKTLLKHLT